VVSDQYSEPHLLLIKTFGRPSVRQPQSLAEVIDLAYTRTGASSGRELEAYAHKHRHKITHTTINAMRHGTYPSKPTPKTLEALAFLSGCNLTAVRKAAGLSRGAVAGRRFADQLPPDVDDLEARPRAVLLEMARVLLDMQRRGVDVTHVDHDSGVSVASLADMGLSGEPVRNGGISETAPHGG
jgi:hypothetical protein